MRSSILGVVAALPLAFASLAQPTQSQPSGRADPVPQPAPKALEPTFNVDFPGGTVREYIELVRRESAKGGGAPANITVTEAAAQFRVPRVQLTSVTAGGAVGFLSRGDNGGESRLYMESTGGDREHQVFSIFVQRLGPLTLTPKPSLLVVSLSDLMNAKGSAPEQQDKQLQTILSAVETALKIGAVESDSAAQLTVHRESGMLLVRGSEAERAIAGDVLTKLRASMLSDEGNWHTKQFELLNVESREIAGAILDVYPDRQDEGPRSIRYEIVGPKQLKVSAPDRVIAGVEALVTLIDRVRSSPRAMERAHFQVEEVEERARVQIASLKDALEHGAEVTHELQKELRVRSMETEDLRAKAIALEKLNERLQRQLDEKK